MEFAHGPTCAHAFSDLTMADGCGCELGSHQGHEVEVRGETSFLPTASLPQRLLRDWFATVPPAT
ncbi:MAG TPA: hypothetical protein VMF06_02325 [Candidatus Limnocylindria bacterium]|nr:hypothetical protein [Candidatus Limnocylindria bacterium]